MLTAILLLVTGCKEATVEEKATRVVVIPARAADVTIYGNYVGHTKASKRVEVNPRVDGFLEEITFVEGSVVDHPYRKRHIHIIEGLGKKKGRGERSYLRKKNNKVVKTHQNTQKPRV